LVTFTACTPDAPYRYTALVPAAHPLAWDGRTAKDGELRVEGTIGGNSIGQNAAPQLHDTALHVPDVTLQGALFLAVAPGLELGGRYTYSSYAWSEISAAGTPPLPSHPSVSGFGPELHLSVPLDKRKRFALGLAGNLMNYTTPYAEWQAVSSCAPGPTCFVDTSTIGGNSPYSLFAERSETHWTTNIAIYPSMNVATDSSAGHAFAGLSAHTGFKNDGFTNAGQNGSTLQDAGLIFFFGAGYGIDLAPAHLAAMIALPLSSSPIAYGLTGFLSLGADIELWEGQETRREQRERTRRQEEQSSPPTSSPPPPASPAPPPVYVIPGSPN
jgi:hypothetical protein